MIVPERGALVHEEVGPRRRLQLAGTEDALAAAEPREWVEIVLLLFLLLGILMLLLLSLLLWLEEELSPVALAQLQRLARRVIAVAGGGGGDVGLLAPLVVARLPAGDGRDALARTLQMEA